MRKLLPSLTFLRYEHGNHRTMGPLNNPTYLHLLACCLLWAYVFVWYKPPELVLVPIAESPPLAPPDSQVTSRHKTQHKHDATRTRPLARPGPRPPVQSSTITTTTTTTATRITARIRPHLMMEQTHARCGHDHHTLSPSHPAQCP